MRLLKQIGPSCTATAAAMILDCEPQDFGYDVHIQMILDRFLSKGYILFEYQPMPSVVTRDGLVDPLLRPQLAEKRLKRILARHRALLYQVPPIGQRHMFAWDPVIGVVDPRFGESVPWPDYIQTTYIMVRYNNDQIKPTTSSID